MYLITCQNHCVCPCFSNHLIYISKMAVEFRSKILMVFSFFFLLFCPIELVPFNLFYCDLSCDPHFLICSYLFPRVTAFVCHIHAGHCHLFFFLFCLSDCGYSAVSHISDAFTLFIFVVSRSRFHIHISPWPYEAFHFGQLKDLGGYSLPSTFCLD